METRHYYGLLSISTLFVVDYLVGSRFSPHYDMATFSLLSTYLYYTITTSGFLKSAAEPIFVPLVFTVHYKLALVAYYAVKENAFAFVCGLAMATYLVNVPQIVTMVEYYLGVKSAAKIAQENLSKEPDLGATLGTLLNTFMKPLMDSSGGKPKSKTQSKQQNQGSSGAPAASSPSKPQPSTNGTEVTITEKEADRKAEAIVESGMNLFKLMQGEDESDEEDEGENDGEDDEENTTEEIEEETVDEDKSVNQEEPKKEAVPVADSQDQGEVKTE